MWRTADRFVRTFSDLTVGTVIVLIHVALADRRSDPATRALPHAAADGTRIWNTQISP